LKAKCAVTFEFIRNQPLTWRGDITATAASTIASRALRQAKKELKPNNWSSLVVVILERDNEEEEVEE
jgi:hypothetical protein